MNSTPQETTHQSSCGNAEHMSEAQRIKEEMELQETISGIKHKIVVLSGKGGVGKSSVAANLSLALSRKGLKTGLLDVDLHGPSIPTLLGMEGAPSPIKPDGRISTVAFSETLKAMSVGLLLENTSDALVWRGPAKQSVIKDLLSLVEWGKLDYLVVDCPPGTGDEPLSVIQLLQNPDGAIIVTTPQDLALVDVRKSITFCRHLKLPIIGIIENMSGYVCPHCDKTADIFKSGGGEKLAEEMRIPFLGRIPIDPEMVLAADRGTPLVAQNEETPAAKALKDAFDKALAFIEQD